MSNRTFKFALSFAFIAAVVSGIAFFLNNRPYQIAVAVPEKDVAVQVFGLGTIEAQIVSNIGFELGATLIELPVDHGNMVKRGGILARLEASEQTARVDRAKAGVHSVEATIARTTVMIERQAAVMTQMETVNRRQQDLLKRNVVAIEKAEEAAKNLAVAKADHDLAMADAAVARATLETARADLAHESTLLAHHLLKAPFDAIVVERHKELGSVVKAGDPVYTIVDANSVWVLAHVEESRSGSIAIGQVAEVRLRSLPRVTFEGNVARIGIESDRVSEERRIWVKCLRCPPDFHLGEQAEVIITTETLPEALLVPELMVSGYDGRRGYVWIAENGKARLVNVSFGQRTLDGRLEITGGLPKNAQVITSPSAGLAEGRAVWINPVPAP